MKRIKSLLEWLFNIFSGLVGISLIGFYVFVYPYLIASKDWPGTIYLIAGIFFYGLIILLTIDLIVNSFSILYNTKRKSILFSPNYNDGTLKPDEETSSGIKFFVILLSYFFIIHVYAIAYLFLGNYTSNSFDNDNITFIDAFFLSFTSITVGPAGISPTSILAKIIVMTEIFWGIIYMVLVLSISASLFIKQAEKKENIN